MRGCALVIEPTKLYRKLLTEIISSHSIEVRCAADGESALDLIAKHNFDFACISLHLPDDSGINLCEKIRQISSMKHIPIVMLTSEQDKEMHSQGLDAGITDILQKSNVHLLSTGIKRLLSQIFSDDKIKGQVLYVNGDTKSATLVIETLKATELSVAPFSSAEDALVAFKAKQFDLVLTDLILDGAMTGIALLNQIRELHGDLSRVPILVLSDNQDNARKIELLRLGANDFVSKPIVAEELKARIKTLISNKQLIDKVESQQEILRNMAETDQLTGLFNRHRLAEMAPIYISQAIRHNHPLSVVVMDIDFFKKINDQHGHAKGDEVLGQVARFLKKNSRQEDFISRIGGEEFVILLPHCDEQDAYDKTNLLRQGIENLRPGGLLVTSSFGIACTSQEIETDFDHIFSAADKAVYVSKQQGRNQVTIGHCQTH